MRLIGLGLAAACLVRAAVGQQDARQPSAAPAVNPETGVVHSRRLASGVPLGGVGAGTFQLMTDGAISRATFNNNWNQPTGDLPGCFAALWTRAAGRTDARALTLKSPYGLPAIAGIDYQGLYPQAILTYPNADLPLTVSLRAFSPLIPFDIKNSSFPAAAFLFEFKNTSLVPVEVSVALSWENILGVGGTVTYGPFHNRTGNRVTHIPDTEGYFGLRFTGPIPANAGSADRLRANASGEYVLLARPERPDAAVTTAGWNVLDAQPAWWNEFARNGSVSGDAPQGQEGRSHPAGVVAVRLTLKPGGFATVPFAFAWHTPHFYALSGADYGHFYVEAFPDAEHAARLLLADWRSLLSLTEEWQRRLLFSNLPGWMARRLINACAPLTENSIHTRDGRFAFVSNVGAAPGAGDVRSVAPGALDSLPEHLAISRLLLAFFPTLEAQALGQFARAQSSAGALPRHLGTLESPDWPAPAPTSGEPQAQPPSTPAPLSPALPDDPDSASAFALLLAEYALWTDDQPFLALYYPAARQALRAILQHDLDPEGLPRAAPADGPFPAGGESGNGLGLRPASATLWLAALRAGQELARREGDRGFAQECVDAATRAASGIQKRFWNGRFYAEPAQAAGPTAAGALCATDQLLGLWAASALGWKDLLPKDDLARAIESLQALNDKAAGMPFGPPQRVRADGKRPSEDPEARDCLLPASLLCQTALYLMQGQEMAGVELWERLDATRNNALRSPWQSPLRFRADTGRAVLPGTGSIAQAADWNALYALEGFTGNLNTGEFRLAPNLPGTWRCLSAPLFAPTFWGHVTFRPTARGGVLTFRLDRLLPLSATTPAQRAVGKASLILRSLRVPGPPRPVRAVPTAHVSLRRVPVGSRAALETDGTLLVTFDAPQTLSAGDRLEIDVH